MRTCRLRVTSSLAIFLLIFVGGCGKETVTTVAPAVVSTVPAAGATGVPVNQVISATFNEAMNPAKDLLVLDGAEDILAEEIAHPDGLREAHSVGVYQAHALRRWHAAGRRALCLGHAHRHGKEDCRKQDMGPRRARHMPANHGNPFSSQ